ncbi:MAG TPA: alkaline phosphatase family protein [Candidatus Binataceae bacterium]|nr:alkaline phosphatase family protein [Candidatus Binataceae bacterium]
MIRTTANICVLIDGLGWEWVKQTSFLSQAAPYRRSLGTVFGFSAGAIPSILTGRHPEQHGRLAMFQRAVDGCSPFARLRWVCSMPPALVENRYVRRAIKSAAAALGRFSGYFSIYKVPLRYLPLLDVAEKRDIYRPGGIPGSTSIFDLLQANGCAWRSYSYHQGSDFSLIDRAREDLDCGAAGFYFLYLSQVDAFLHAHADSPPLVAARLAEYDARLTDLCRVARRRHARVRLRIFSDHGMAPTRASVDLRPILGALPAAAPRDYLCLLDSTMARFWFFAAGTRALVMNALDDGGAGRWLDEAELRSLRAWFPDRRYGEEIYLLPEGRVFAPSHMGLAAPNGMHGFHPDAAHSKAALLSSEECGAGVEHITAVFGLMRSCALGEN